MFIKKSQLQNFSISFNRGSVHSYQTYLDKDRHSSVSSWMSGKVGLHGLVRYLLRLKLYPFVVL